MDGRGAFQWRWRWGITLAGAAGKANVGPGASENVLILSFGLGQKFVTSIKFIGSGNLCGMLYAWQGYWPSVRSGISRIVFVCIVLWGYYKLFGQTSIFWGKHERKYCVSIWFSITLSCVSSSYLRYTILKMLLYRRKRYRKYILGMTKRCKSKTSVVIEEIGRKTKDNNSRVDLFELFYIFGNQ